MAKLFTHIIEVVPSGLVWPFPIDMLRYDKLHPKTETDSSVITSTLFRKRTKEEKKSIHKAKVFLTRQAEKNWEPTYERWKSFGWIVIGHTKS